MHVGNFARWVELEEVGVEERQVAERARDGQGADVLLDPELRRRLPNCTERMLTVQLRELEEDGLVVRTVFAEVPPRVEYELTTFGASLKPILAAMKEWGERYKRRLAWSSSWRDQGGSPHPWGAVT